MTRKYRLERTAFIGCRNTAYMDVDDAEPCPFCGSRQVTIYPYGQGTTSYVEGEDEYNACIAALKTWNTRYSEKGKELNHGH